MKPKTTAAAALVAFAWVAVLVAVGALRVAKHDAEQEANAEIARLNSEVRRLTEELVAERIPTPDDCLNKLRLRIVRVPYDEHGVMIEQARLIPQRPDCFGGRYLRITNLVVRDGQLVLGGRPLVVR